MKAFGLTILLFLCLASAMRGATPIVGEHTVDACTLTRFVQRHNPDFCHEIAEALIEQGERYGIRGDIAFCQAIIETGWFRFDNGTAVTPDMHNYCGLGVTRLGKTGCSFSSITEGVRAMLQHLYAYCCDLPLPDDEEIVDPRFDLVTRGCAPTWEKLSGRWAANRAYGTNILSLFQQAAALPPASIVEVIEVEIPDELLLTEVK